MGDEQRGGAPERSRADVYSSARIGAAAALTLVLVVLLVLDVAVPDYDIGPGIGGKRLRLKTDTVTAATRPDSEGGRDLALARIARERHQAALRFARDRDLGRLEATMARLDAEAAATAVRPSR